MFLFLLFELHQSNLTLCPYSIYNEIYLLIHESALIKDVMSIKVWER